MTELPERIWAGKYGTTWWQSRPHHQMTEYLRADTAIPRAEVDAMAAAALDRAAQACEKAAYSGKYPRDDMAELGCLRCRDDVKNLTPADVRAAFEQAVQEAEQRGWARGMEAKVHFAAEAAVQEAVRAERERCAKIADSYHEAAIKWASTNMKSFDGVFDGVTDSKRIAAAIRAPQEPSE